MYLKQVVRIRFGGKKVQFVEKNKDQMNRKCHPWAKPSSGDALWRLICGQVGPNAGSTGFNIGFRLKNGHFIYCWLLRRLEWWQSSSDMLINLKEMGFLERFYPLHPCFILQSCMELEMFATIKLHHWRLQVESWWKEILIIKIHRPSSCQQLGTHDFLLLETLFI